MIADGDTALASSSSGGGTGEASSDGGALDGSAASSGSSGTSSSSSSGGAPDEGGSPPPSTGTIVEQTFLAPAACTGLSVTNGGTKTFEPGERSTGACKVCAASPGSVHVELSGTATKSGQATFEGYARRVGADACEREHHVRCRRLERGVVERYQRDLGAHRRRIDHVQNGSAALLRIGISNATAGECIVIDDVSAVP